jgi:hypothetical protein
MLLVATELPPIDTIVSEKRRKSSLATSAYCILGYGFSLVWNTYLEAFNRVTVRF